MRVIARLPYGMALAVDPDNGNPWIRMSGGGYTRPHELRFCPERPRLLDELKRIEREAERDGWPTRELMAARQAVGVLEWNPNRGRWEAAA